MPSYDWTCHACHSSNKAGTDRCSNCGCPAVATGKAIQSFVEPERSTLAEKKEQRPITPAGSAAIVLFGLFLLVGAVFQVVEGKCFPLFPVQIDVFFGIFKSLLGANAGIYASSLLAGALGLLLSWFGIFCLRRKDD